MKMKMKMILIANKRKCVVEPNNVWSLVFRPMYQADFCGEIGHGSTESIGIFTISSPIFK